MLHTRGFVPYRGWGGEVVFAGTLSRYPSDRGLGSDTAPDTAKKDTTDRYHIPGFSYLRVRLKRTHRYNFYARLRNSLGSVRYVCRFVW